MILPQQFHVASIAMQLKYNDIIVVLWQFHGSLALDFKDHGMDRAPRPGIYQNRITK